MTLLVLQHRHLVSCLVNVARSVGGHGREPAKPHQHCGEQLQPVGNRHLPKTRPEYNGMSPADHRAYATRSSVQSYDREPGEP